MLHAFFAPFLPRVDDHFRIRMGAEAMPARDQLRHEIAEVVDFAVEDHHHAVIFVEQRLLAR